MNSWDEWIQRHRSEMEHIADYEIRFVREVLSKIPELEPEDVIPQYPFFDEKKKLRRIDFMILNVDNGFALAIEIDGYWKAENYANFDEMLSRQNALLENMNCLLIRYSNKKWINNRKVVIAEIREVLQKQNIEHQTRLLQKEHQLKVDQKINKIIEESQLIKQEIQQVRKEVERSAQSKDPIILQDTSEKSSVQNKTKTILPLFFVTCLILLGFFFYEQSNNQVTAETVNVPNVVDTTKTEAKARQIPYGDSNDDLMIITTREAEKFVGKDVILCAELNEIRFYKQKTFLNLDALYPKCLISAVIEDQDAFNFRGINRHVGEKICIQGKVIRQYNKLRIRLKEKQQWLSF